MMGLSIKDNSRLITDRLGQIVTHIPLASHSETKKIAEIFLKHLDENSPLWENSPSKPTIKSSLKVVEIEGGYGVTMVKHGFLVDQMDPHWAPSGFGEEEDPVMKFWLEDKLGWSEGGFNLPWFWVKPTPWITESLSRGAEAMREYAKGGKTEFAKILKSLKG